MSQYKGYTNFKNNYFLKYKFFRNFKKRGKKLYFLFDFFNNLKIRISYKISKKLNKKYNFYLYNSYNRLNLNINSLNKFDYYINFFKFNIIHNFKKKEKFFFNYLIEPKNIFFRQLKNVWAIKYFLNLKNIFINNINYFKTRNYELIFKLDEYYDFIKKFFINSLSYVINEYVLLYNINFNYMSIFEFGYLFDGNYILNYNFFSNYNLNQSTSDNSIYKIILKLNRFFYNIKNINSWSLKKKIYKFIEVLKPCDFVFFNKSKIALINRTFYFKYNINLKCDKREKIKNINLIKMFYYYINFYYRINLQYFFNNKKNSAVILQHYFSYYNLIIKFLLKLLIIFKFILVLNTKKLLNYLINNLIILKIYIILQYYKKIILNFREKKFKLRNFIKNMNLKYLLSRNKIVELKLNLFYKRAPLWKKKWAINKFDQKLSEFKIKIKYIKYISYFKKGHFFNLNIYLLRKIYFRLKSKIKKIKKIKKLKIKKLVKLMKNNNFKIYTILKLKNIKKSLKEQKLEDFLKYFNKFKGVHKKNFLKIFKYARTKRYF
jgi:hypothetical protein